MSALFPLFAITAVFAILFFPAPAAPIDCPVAAERLDSKFLGPKGYGFWTYMLLVDPGIKNKCGLDYDTDQWAVVRLGFFGATAPDLDDLEQDSIFLEGLPAQRLTVPDETLPGKKDGIFQPATVGPNAVEVWFRIPADFWATEREVKFEASIDGLRFSQGCKVRAQP